MAANECRIFSASLKTIGGKPIQIGLTSTSSKAMPSVTKISVSMANRPWCRRRGAAADAPAPVCSTPTSRAKGCWMKGACVDSIVLLVNTSVIFNPFCLLQERRSIASMAYLIELQSSFSSDFITSVVTQTIHPLFPVPVNFK